MDYKNPQISTSLINKLGIKQIVDIRDKLPVNPNYTWAQLAGVRPLESLTTIVNHHDAYPKKNRVDKPDLNLAIEIANDHINKTADHASGEAGFPYEFWIRNGTAYWCNDILPRKYCVSGNNGYTVNVCVSGDFATHDSLTDMERNLLYALNIMLQEILPNYKALVGHNQLQAKSCPGYDMNRVRKDIEAIKLEMSLDNTPNDNLARVFTMGARFNDLYARATNNNDRYQSEAQRKILLMEEDWKARGIIPK
jgi:hypothetical protein